MKTQTLFLALLTVILTAGTVQAENKLPQELSNTRYAYADLRITADPIVFPMGITDNDTERISDLLFSQEVLASAAKEILGTSDFDGKNQFLHPAKEIPIKIGDMQVIRVQLSVALDNKHKPAAKEFLEAYIKKLKEKLIKEYKFARRPYADKLSVYQSYRDRAQQNLQELLEQQNSLAGGRGTLDKESVRQRILENEKVRIENDLQMTILGKRAGEISKQISDAKDETLQRIQEAQGELLKIDKMIDNCDTELKKIKTERDRLVKDNTTPQEKRGMIEDKLAETVKMYSELTSEKERLGSVMTVLQSRLKNQSAKDVQGLNKQLRETTMQLEELNIKKSYLYGYSPGSLEDSMQYEMLEVQIEAAKEKLKRVSIEFEEAALQHDLLQPPTVSYDEIICSETVPECK